jgi:hypothetical protein
MHTVYYGKVSVWLFEPKSQHVYYGISHPLSIGVLQMSYTKRAAQILFLEDFQLVLKSWIQSF